MEMIYGRSYICMHVHGWSWGVEVDLENDVLIWKTKIFDLENDNGLFGKSKADSENQWLIWKFEG